MKTKSLAAYLLVLAGLWKVRKLQLLAVHHSRPRLKSTWLAIVSIRLYRACYSRRCTCRYSVSTWAHRTFSWLEPSIWNIRCSGDRV